MPKWLIVFFAICVIGGMGLIVHYGIQPRTVKIMKPSYFSSQKELATTVAGLLEEQFGKSNVMIAVASESSYLGATTEAFAGAVRSKSLGVTQVSPFGEVPGTGETLLTIFDLALVSGGSKFQDANCFQNSLSREDRLRCFAEFQWRQLQRTRGVKWEKAVATLELVGHQHYVLYVHLPDDHSVP